MNQKTNFSYEVKYLADSDMTQVQREELLNSLGPRLEQVLSAQDSTASVAVSHSYRGPHTKIIELTTTLQDAQIAQILQAFTEEHGVVMQALE
ncbi:MAG: hypothetical protein M3R45_06085 [Pseudomonadota bacterium]|nr:hypothetical protein [Pseudomonadota bacterium]